MEHCRKGRYLAVLFSVVEMLLHFLSLNSSNSIILLTDPLALILFLRQTRSFWNRMDWHFWCQDHLPLCSCNHGRLFSIVCSKRSHRSHSGKLEYSSWSILKSTILSLAWSESSFQFDLFIIFP